ncbi:MAG TPA: hypothetical protein VGF82_08085 [Terracidiphilus sp.]|jgi:hypothetical protein
MDEPLKTFSKDLAEQFKAALASQSIEDFVKQAKASGDDRSFEVVMSTSDEDRQGDSLDQSRWDLKYYTMNPVVLWAHNYSSFPIGVVTDIKIQGDKAVATGKFAPEGVNPDADMACKLYQAKILRAVSPGYIQNDDGTRELLEVSFCPVPAGRYALSLRQVSELGVSTRELVTKGFFYDAKGPVVYKDHGAAEPDTEWDGPAEVKACGEDLSKLKSICAWFDSDNADVKSTYKLPHHRASDLKAVWKGVAAAAAALQGGSGGVEIPSDDLANVKSHIVSHYKEFGRTPPWEQKSAQAGDHCELEDGTPGVLADDDKNPSSLICVPSKSKSESMNEDLTKTFKAENERHGKAIAKSIDEFKSIEEFEKSIDSEQEDHLEKCMKAIDGAYALEDQHPKKSIDEFKSAVSDEHLTHIKATDKAIDEFKAEDGDDHEKAIEEFTKKIGTELDRHEKAHDNLCKAEAAGEADEEKSFTDYAEMLAAPLFGSADAITLSKVKFIDAVAKSGRAISAKNKDAIEKIIKAIEDHHTEHGKSSDEITAALKAIASSGGGGEESSDGDEPDKKTLNSRSSTSGATAELETYLFTQRLVRQVKTASEGALRQINEKIKETRSSGR